MKHHALFSSKDESKKNELSSAALFIMRFQDSDVPSLTLRIFGL